MKIARQSLFIILTLVSGASLSACERKSGSDAFETQGFTASSTVKEQRFGKAFEEARRADPKSEPHDNSKNALPPISYTDEPVQFD